MIHIESPRILESIILPSLDYYLNWSPEKLVSSHHLNNIYL
nr:MAG TPA: hypothetical protein [Caudoviricetes sp.]